jgi:hypothetical protein
MLNRLIVLQQHIPDVAVWGLGALSAFSHEDDVFMLSGETRILEWGLPGVSPSKRAVRRPMNEVRTESRSSEIAP